MMGKKRWAKVGVAGALLCVVVSAARAGSVESGPSRAELVERATAAGKAQQQENVEALLDSFGDLMRPVDLRSERPRRWAFAVADAPAPLGLPNGVETGAFIFGQGNGAAVMKQLCGITEEKGRKYLPCRKVKTDAGDLRIQRQIGPGGADRGEEDMLRVMYVQPDGELMIASLWVVDETVRSTSKRRAATRAWLAGMQDRLISVATHPSVDPAGYVG